MSFDHTQIKRLRKSHALLEKARVETDAVLQEKLNDWHDLTEEAQQSDKHSTLREDVEALESYVELICAAIEAEI